MADSDLRNFIGELRARVGRMPGRPKRGEFLARARAIPLQWNPTEFPATRSLTDQFKQALMPWGAQVQVVASTADVMPAIKRIFQDHGIGRATRWRTPLIDSLDWKSGLDGLAVDWIMPTAGELEACAEEHRKREVMLRLETVEAGVTDCAFGVAQTGSLLCLHDAERNGYASLFPWVHIALLPVERIVRDLPEAFRRLDEHLAVNPVHGSVTFITGPSRSGDIDIVAGQGAAGPGKMHILLIQNSIENSSGSLSH